MEIKIENYTDTDFEDWRRMSLELFRDYPADEIENDLQNIITDSNRCTFIAKNSGDVMGFATVSIRADDHVEGASTTPVGYLEAIFVDPEYRKHGVAGRLVKQAEAWVAERGCTEIGSDTWEWNKAAQQFHENTGFQKKEVLVHYIKAISKK